MKYLNPKADLMLNRVFGDHPDLMISLLNALLPLTPEQEITEIEYLTPELMPDNPLRKFSILDVCCKDKLGRQFLVELQTIWSPEFMQRFVFKANKVYACQTGVGKQYELLQPVYSLNLVNGIFEPDLTGYYHHYKLIHVEHTDKVIEGLQLIFVELPKFTPHTFSEKKMHVLWLRYLTEIDENTREAPAELLANPQVKKALNELEESAFTEAQLLGYEKFWDIISVEKTLYYSAERKGMKKGLEQGLEQGLAEGIRLTATNFKKQGITPEIIAQCTGLSIEEINAL